jgi:hypothetical protein
MSFGGDVAQMRSQVVTQFLEVRVGRRRTAHLREDLGGATHAFGPPLDGQVVRPDAIGLGLRQQLSEVGRAQIRRSRLWELVLADIAEAEFIEAGVVSQLMQPIDHVVMTTLKSSINVGRLQYH